MKGFFAYYDTTKTTSGQRFYVNLATRLNMLGAPNWRSARVMLFNVSAPLGLIARARLSRKIIVLRVDGLYFDRVSRHFLSRLSLPVRTVVRLLMLSGWDSAAAHIANFFNQNWKTFARIMLADHIVYQSAYCRAVYHTYFPRKPCSLVVNGADMVEGLPEGNRSLHADRHRLKLITIYDEWRPSKRVCELISFVKWAYEVKRADIELTLLGYTGRFPSHATEGIRHWVERMPCFRTLPKFKSFDGEVRQALLDADMYITFSYRDPCPNAVVEAMAHGLPVVAMSSGGIPDIVGDAGVLLPANDPGQFFCAWRFESDFPEIDFEQVWAAVQHVGREQALYRQRVRQRFVEELSMDIVVARYKRLLSELAERYE